jgi:hypothetical protein
MATRSADATIKGYYYQFDTTIIRLIQLSADSDSVVVEGIEDIDIHTATESEAIQCKYLSKPTFTNSAVREPITLMLDHYVGSSAAPLKYTLYAHFEEEKQGSEPAIDLALLKSILTYKENKVEKRHWEEKSISDTQLTEFLDHFTLKFGIEFDQQQKTTIAALKKHFECSDYEADCYFYNNALRVVLDKARSREERARKITRAEFLSAIDGSADLFTEWYIKQKTKKQYLGQIKQVLQTSKALAPSRSKYLFVGREILGAHNEKMPIGIFIENLIDRYYKFGTSLRTAIPLGIILDMDLDAIRSLKAELMRKDIVFNDGNEHIEFSPAFFERLPVVNSNKNQTKIKAASFAIKIISLTTFMDHQGAIPVPKVVLHFSRGNCPYGRVGSYQWFDIKYCDNLLEISTLLL